MPGFIRNGAQLLLLVRDSASSWEQLCDQIGIDRTSPADRSNRMTLSRVITDLRKAGLIEHDGEQPEGCADIKVAEQWNLIQAALGRPTLSHIGDIADSADGVVVKPIFGRPAARDDKAAEVFVLMPFNAELEPLYRDHLKKLGEELGVTVRRADDTHSFGPFINKVWNAIHSADLIIADCTQRNPNVFYEVGMAHVLGKPVVFITRSDEDIPSDIKHLEYIAYSYDEEGVDSLLARLKEIITDTVVAKRTRR